MLCGGVSCSECCLLGNVCYGCHEEIHDDGLKGSKHVGLFINSVLSDFSVT